MKDDYVTRMANDCCFVSICEGYEQWCKDKSPGVGSVNLVAICFSCLAALLLCWAARDATMAVCTVIGSIIVFAGLYKPEWPPLLDGYLSDYDPVDDAAFSLFQQTVSTAGILEKEALGEWIALERLARERSKTPGLRFTKRSTQND